MRHLHSLALIALAACADGADRADPLVAPLLDGTDEVTLANDDGAADADTAASLYLGGLTQEDVDDMASRYGLDLLDFQERVSAPFRCDHFGDLCAIMSPASGEAIILDVIDRMAAGQEPSEIQLAVEAQEGPAQAAWEQEQLALGQPFYGSPNKIATKAYTNRAGQACKIEVRSIIVNYGFQVEHQAKLNNSCWSTFGFYTPSLVGSLRVCLDSKRVGGGSTSTTNLCSSASNWDSVGRSNWMPASGTHTAKATGTASGSTISGSVSTSTTATWW